MVTKSIIEITKRYLESIPKEHSFKNAYLFGSFARGNENENSDIDIAIVFPKIDNLFELQMLLMRLRRDIDLRIEAHPISETDFNSNHPLANEILKFGIKLN
jgi:predicted nucleotidyltransferase